MARTDAVNDLSGEEMRRLVEVSAPLAARLLRLDRFLRRLDHRGEHGSDPYVGLKTLRELAQQAAMGSAMNARLKRELTAHERKDAQEIQRARRKKGLA